jgi:hypothetical protein
MEFRWTADALSPKLLNELSRLPFDARQGVLAERFVLGGRGATSVSAFTLLKERLDNIRHMEAFTALHGRVFRERSQGIFHHLA